jgi:hypothetical protein
MENTMNPYKKTSQRSLTDSIPELTAAMRTAEESCARVRFFLIELRRQTYSSPIAPSDPNRFMVTENGSRHPATQEEIEVLRKTWSGHFLLDLPLQTLRIQKDGVIQQHSFHQAKLRRGLVRLLVFGMKSPGKAFGTWYPQSFQISSERTLARYVRDLRRFLGDSGHHPSILLTTADYSGVSASGYGYVFSENWNYLVIEKKCLFNRKFYMSVHT